MNFRFYHEKLVNSDLYKNFIKKNPRAYPCSGFFILDREKEGSGNMVHFDFWLPKEKKMHSFRVDGKVELLPVENFETKPFEEISLDYDFDLEEFEKVIFERMENEKVKGKIQKLLFSFQRLKGKDFLIATVFLSNLGLLKANIRLEDRKIISFEKKSFFDMMNILKKKKKA